MQELPSFSSIAIPTPFASGNGATKTIPGKSTSSNAVNMPLGFPGVFSKLINNGGAYLRREDFNGIFYLITLGMQYLHSGGVMKWDSTYQGNTADGISGYPKDAILWFNVGTQNDQKWCLIQSLVKGNTYTPSFILNATTGEYDATGTAIGKWKVIARFDQDYVNKTTAQSIDGAKTFTGNLTASANINASGSIVAGSGIYGTRSGNTGTPVKSATASDAEQEGTFVATLGWVRTRLSNWWSNICTNTEVSFSKKFKVGSGVTIDPNGSSVTATKFTGYLSGSISGDAGGNAATATKLKSGRTLTITDGSHTGDGTSFDGSGNATLKLPATITASINGTASGNLPLAGGTMTGTIKMSNGTSVKSDNDSTPLVLKGGLTDTSGAKLTLNGSGSTYSPFTLSANGEVDIVVNGNTTSAQTELVGKNNGSLTWCGKQLVRTINGSYPDENGNFSINEQKQTISIEDALPSSLANNVVYFCKI